MAKWRNDGARFPVEKDSDQFIEHGEVFEAEASDFVVRQRVNKLTELKPSTAEVPAPSNEEVE